MVVLKTLSQAGVPLQTEIDSDGRRLETVLDILRY